MSESRNHYASGGLIEPTGGEVSIPAFGDVGYVIPASAIRDYGTKLMEPLKKQDGDG